METQEQTDMAHTNEPEIRVGMASQGDERTDITTDMADARQRASESETLLAEYSELEKSQAHSVALASEDRLMREQYGVAPAKRLLEARVAERNATTDTPEVPDSELWNATDGVLARHGRL